MKEVKVKLRPFPVRFYRSYRGWRKIGLPIIDSIVAAYIISTSIWR
jgi:hypothetical protein